MSPSSGHTAKIMNYRHQLSLLSLLCLAAPLCAQSEDLRTTAAKGSSVWLLQTQKQEQAIDIGGQEMETEQTTTRTVHVTIKDIDDKGNLVVETKIVRVQGSATMPMGMGDYEFDSATEKPAAADAEEEDDGEGFGGMGEMMKKMQMAGVGKSFTAKVNRHGKVVELTDGVAEIVGDGGGGMMMGAGIGKGTLTQIVETAFGVLTDKPVAVGGTWEHKQNDAEGRMPAEHTMVMTLAKADGESFEVTTTGTVSTPAEKGDPAAKPEEESGSEEEAAARQMMKDMKVKNGKITGSQKISRMDGFVIEATSTMSMDVEMDSPMGEMSMTMKATNTTKRTTAEAAMAVKKAEAAKEPAKEEVVKEAGK